MLHNKSLVLLRTAAIIVVALSLSCGISLAQRGSRPAPTASADGAAGSRRDARFRGAARPHPGTASASASAEITDTPAPRKGPLDINTLRYAFIDPKSHAVTFVGKYDPAYATGPIPYADILKDAMENPYPSFSIEPSQQQREQFDQMDKLITADIAKMHDASYCNQWAQNLMNLLLNDASLQKDSKRFFSKFGDGAGLSGDEMKRLYDAAAGKISIEPGESFTLAAKMMRGVGAPGAADGLMALAAGGTPEDLLRNMAKALGLASQFQDLEGKGLSGDEFKTEAIILCISEMCRQFEAPENEITSTVASIRSGQETASALIGYMSTQMGNFITNKAGTRMMNGLVMGPELMAKLYNLPVPQSDMLFTNVASDSQLGDVLFKADYRLKSICVFPDARERMPVHVTNQEFMQKEAAATGYDLSAGSGADLGHRLVPADVKMRVSPNGDLVEFQNSQVKVIGWVRGSLGNENKGTTDFINSVTPKYADFLTQHYDEYAKVYPEWHKMSEVAKIIALARWAKKSGYAISAADASGAKITHPKQVNGFWSAVFQVNGEKASMTVIAEGGASFSSDEGEDWVKPQSDAEVTSDVNKQLVASAVLGEQALNALGSGDLDAARDLAEKSARAMTGEIDLTQLPSLDGIPAPTDPASYAAATSEVISEASECLNKMDTAQKDLARAGQLAATSPDEAKKITEQATKDQDEAQARLKEILAGVSTYKADPSKAGDVVVTLQGKPTVTPPASGGTASSGTSVAQGTNTTPATPTAKDWPAEYAKLKAELDKVNQQIASTREVLLKLSASIQSDSKQFADWEKSADDAFDRCVGIAADTAIDFGAGPLSERYDTIYELAKKLPGKPDDVIEKYRLLASLAKRLKEAKATNDLDGLAKRENKTDTEIYESIRDGIGQVSSLLGLDKTVPGMFWKYGSVACDLAYNLTELRLGWKAVGTLEENNARYAEAVKKLAARMQELIERQKKLSSEIEAGEQTQTR